MNFKKIIIVTFVLSANPNIASGALDNFKTPLHTSAEHGFLKNVKKLVDAGADATAAEGHGMTAIDLAEQHGHVVVFEYLKNAASSKEQTRENLHCCLRESIVNSEELSVVENLMKEVAKNEAHMIVNMTPNGSNTLLFK